MDIRDLFNKAKIKFIEDLNNELLLINKNKIQLQNLFVSNYGRYLISIYKELNDFNKLDIKDLLIILNDFQTDYKNEIFSLKVEFQKNNNNINNLRINDIDWRVDYKVIFYLVKIFVITDLLEIKKNANIVNIKSFITVSPKKVFLVQ